MKASSSFTSDGGTPGSPREGHSLDLPSPARLLIVAGIVLLGLLSLACYTFFSPFAAARSGSPIPGTPGVRGFVLPEGKNPGALEIHEVAALSKAGRFKPMRPPGNERAGQLTSGGQQWNRIDFDNPSSEYKRVTLDLIWRSYDATTLYIPTRSGAWQRMVDGEQISPDDPEMSERWRAFEIVLPPKQTLSIFLHTQDFYHLPTEFSYWENPGDFSARERSMFIHHFVYFGLLFGILIYCFFLYAVMRQKDQLYALLFIGSRGITTLFASNMANLLFPYPSLPLREILVVLFGTLVLWSLCLLARHFLETARSDPPFDRVLTWALRIIGVWGVLALLGLWATTAHLSLKAHLLMGIGVTLLVLWGSIRAFRHGLQQGRFFFIAFAPFLAGLLSLLAFTGGTMVQDAPGRLLFLLGTGLNMLLLVLALAYRHRLIVGRSLQHHQEYAGKLEHAVAHGSEVLQSFNNHLAAMARRGRTATAISHEQGNPSGPATTLHSLAHRLANEGEHLDREELSRIASQISHACILKLELLDNLLIWSSTQSESWKPQHDPLCLLEEIANAWDSLESLSAGRSVTLRTKIHADLLIASDGQLLQAVLRNLLGNAIRSSHPESVIEVACQVFPGSGGVEICVRDSGVGIPPEHLSMLFGTKRSAPGDEPLSGIELPLCRDLIRAMGGEMRIDSVPNLGTNITFTLPDAVDHTIDQAQENSSPRLV